MRRFVGFFLCGLFLIVGVADACNPYFLPGYFVVPCKDLSHLPELSFKRELVQLLVPAVAADGVPMTGDESGMAFARQRILSTSQADLADLGEALKTSLGDEATRQAVLDAYARFREALGRRAEEGAACRMERQERGPSAGGTVPEPDWTRLPVEFVEYARGAMAYHDGRVDEAVTHWNNVLALPEEQRRYKTVWALYMLGRVALDTDPAAAVDYLEQARGAAASGAVDSLRLTLDALGCQARAETRLKRYADALRHYAALAKEHDWALRAMDSIRCVLYLMMSERTLEPGIVKDDLCRQMVMLAYCSGQGRASADVGVSGLLAQAIEASGLKPPISGADRMAWAAYNRGDMEAVGFWLDKAEADTPRSRWVRSRLLAREGKIEEAMGLVEALRTELGQGVEAPLLLPNEERGTIETASARLQGDLACLLLQRQEYGEALQGFLQSAHVQDALYVAECVMTTDELASFLQEHEKGLDNAGVFRYVLASRLADQDRWAEAIPYFPEQTAPRPNHGPSESVHLRELAEEMERDLTQGRDKSLSVRERAERLMEAARILRRSGMELVGRELAPDWRCEQGVYCLNMGTPTSPAEARRVAASAAKPMKRYHYRYKAADLMWEAARMLPDNDPLTARALYEGGVFVEYIAPDVADRFYKALVRRNPNLEIAQRADKLRWFPKEFTEAVAYWPRPYWSEARIRKVQGVGVCLGGVALVGLLGVWGVRRGRVRKVADKNVCPTLGREEKREPGGK